jgi:hypothetical protein
MPRRKDIPPEGARMLAAVLAGVRPADVGMLRDLELDWPGSRALLARLGVALAAQNPQEAEECLRKFLGASLDAYRSARKVRTGDQCRDTAGDACRRHRRQCAEAVLTGPLCVKTRLGPASTG